VDFVIQIGVVPMIEKAPQDFVSDLTVKMGKMD
jgi:hypothetical protein